MLSKFQIFIDIGKFILIKIPPKWAEVRGSFADGKIVVHCLNALCEHRKKKKKDHFSCYIGLIADISSSYPQIHAPPSLVTELQVTDYIYGPSLLRSMTM